MENVFEVLKYLASGVGGVLLGHLFGYRVSMRKQNLPEFEAIITRYKEITDHQKAEIEELKGELYKIYQKNEEIMQELLMFRANQ